MPKIDLQMSHKRVLYVCQEIKPYLPDSHMSVLCRKLPQAIQEKGFEIRTFMPKYGSINERRDQLHEVIRLSGMNLIIDDNDHQLIIKVASIPSARVQIYFIDNEEYFQRKFILTDENGNYFEDNDERAVFFARGVLETVRKLRWSPDVVHCHGWFSGFTAMYLKSVFADDPLFADLKIVVSLYNDPFPGALDANLTAKLQEEGVGKKETEILENPDYFNLLKFYGGYADGIIFAEEGIDPAIREYFVNSGLPLLDASTSEDPAAEYADFYNGL